MSNLDKLLGIDPGDPQVVLAAALVRADIELLRALIDRRERAGLTQQDVADRLGIAQPSVAKFERYDNDPKLSTIRRYALAVGALVNHSVDDQNVRVTRGTATARATTTGQTHLTMQFFEADNAGTNGRWETPDIRNYERIR